MLIRPTTKDDIAPITDIYRHHVLHGTGSFETVPPDAAEMARRWQAVTTQNMPHWVLSDGGRVLGYAYAQPFRPRQAYRHTLEDSIYLHPDARGRGVGSLLLAELLQPLIWHRLRMRGQLVMATLVARHAQSTAKRIRNIRSMHVQPAPEPDHASRRKFSNRIVCAARLGPNDGNRIARSTRCRQRLVDHRNCNPASSKLSCHAGTGNACADNHCLGDVSDWLRMLWPERSKTLALAAIAGAFTDRKSCRCQCAPDVTGHAPAGHARTGRCESGQPEYRAFRPHRRIAIRCKAIQVKGIELSAERRQPV